MAMDVEYVHNRNVFEVLIGLRNKMEIEKCQILGAASNHV
jgi:hypothetical protein